MTPLYALGAILGLVGCGVAASLVVVGYTRVRDLDWIVVLPYVLLAVVSVAALVEHG